MLSATVTVPPLARAVRMLASRENTDLEKELHNLYKMYLAGQDYLMKTKGTSGSMLNTDKRPSIVL